MTFILWLIEKFIGNWDVSYPKQTNPKILVIDLNFVGDVLQSSPIYRALKEHWPGCQIDVLCYANTREVHLANPYIDNIYHPTGKRFWDLFVVATELRRLNYDLALQLNTSLKTNFLLWIIGRRYRLGYNYKHRGCLLNVRVPIEHRTNRQGNRIDENLQLFSRAFGWKNLNPEMIFEIPRGFHKFHVDQMGEILPIALHVNCRQDWERRRWEPWKWVRLARELHDRYGCTLVFTGEKKDIPYIEQIYSTCRDISVNLAGQTSLSELAALMDRLSLFVTLNTGVMHLAIARKCPCVVVLGGTPASICAQLPNHVFDYVEDPGLASYNPDKPKEYIPKMEEIQVSEVLKLCDKIIRR
jgi:heptosyltransferase-2